MQEKSEKEEQRNKNKPNKMVDFSLIILNVNM